MLSTTKPDTKRTGVGKNTPNEAFRIKGNL